MTRRRLLPLRCDVARRAQPCEHFIELFAVERLDRGNRPCRASLQAARSSACELAVSADEDRRRPCVAAGLRRRGIRFVVAMPSSFGICKSIRIRS